MTGATRIWAAALIAALAITRADAADLTPDAGTAPAGSADLLRPCRRPGCLLLAARRAVDRGRVLEGNTDRHPPRYRNIK